MEINHVQEINIKNILEILSTVSIKLIDGKDILVFICRLKDSPIQINAEVIDNKKKKARLFFFNGKKNNVIIGKSITKIKFNITDYKKRLYVLFHNILLED
jgi:hypothetical protein